LGRSVSEAGALVESIQSWLAQPDPALLDVKVLPMQLVTPPFVSKEAVVGMAVYSARAILPGKSHDVWEDGRREYFSRKESQCPNLTRARR
jgi:pyruvate dehydrogenase (quinone)